MNYLIDTDIIIYSLKGKQTVITLFEERLNDPKSISVITYGELVYGARKSQREEKNMARVRRIAEIFPIIASTLRTAPASITKPVAGTCTRGGGQKPDTDGKIHPPG